MNIEHAINWSILNYPTLYRMKTHEESRLQVLNQYFLVIGNGMDWTKEGYLLDLCEKHPEKELVKKLPKDFYDKELYKFDIDPQMLKEAKQELRDNKVWFKVRKNYFGSTIVFAWSKELALPFVIKYECEKDKQERAHYAEIFKDFPSMQTTFGTRLREASAVGHPFSPYPICQYSALVEMINKRTNSLHIENFDLAYVKEDWIQGAIDVATATLEYYNDESRYSNNSYHPSKCFQQFKKSYDQDPEKYRADRVAEGMTHEMSIKEWCQFWWDKFRTEQIDYCNRFLEMYDQDFTKNPSPVA